MDTKTLPLISAARVNYFLMGDGSLTPYEIIENLRRRGLRPVRLDQIKDAEGIQRHARSILFLSAELPAKGERITMRHIDGNGTHSEITMSAEEKYDFPLGERVAAVNI